jgi:hypothetical protein
MMNIEELINLGEERLDVNVIDIQYDVCIRNHNAIRHNNMTIPKHTLFRIVRVFYNKKNRMQVRLAAIYYYLNDYADPVHLYFNSTPYKLEYEFYRLEIDKALSHDHD